MADSTLWWLAAGGLIAVELITGTFYLLMLSTGLVAAALSAHAGLETKWQWVIAAAVGGGSVVAWYFYKKSSPPTAPAQSNHDVNMDIGATVHVTFWREDGTCSVKYRGAQWTAELAAGETADSGNYTIAEVIGSRLILKQTHTF
ncbi:MAG: NfeD family protein [Rhodoferax sp.]|jgi:membrane protein implicated in regulation of membrane protease activity|nr:NfeD family protein [Rhodoferax sp.]